MISHVNVNVFAFERSLRKWKKEEIYQFNSIISYISVQSLFIYSKHASLTPVLFCSSACGVLRITHPFVAWRISMNEKATGLMNVLYASYDNDNNNDECWFQAVPENHMRWTGNAVSDRQRLIDFTTDVCSSHWIVDQNNSISFAIM